MTPTGARGRADGTQAVRRTLTAGPAGAVGRRVDAFAPFKPIPVRGNDARSAHPRVSGGRLLSAPGVVGELDLVVDEREDDGVEASAGSELACRVADVRLYGLG